MTDFEVSHDGSIPIAITAETAEEAKDAFVSEAEALGEPVCREYLTVERVGNPSFASVGELSRRKYDGR